MPRFYFHVHDGRDNPDAEGIELSGWIAARDEAVRRAGRIMDDAAQPGTPGERRYVEVTDDAGLLLFRLDVATTPPTASPDEAAAEIG